MISSVDLDYFLTLAKELNLTRAARELNLSQPALTHALQRLEESLGCQLFLRSKSGLKLTSQGEWLKRNSENLVTQLRELPGELLRMGNSLSGKFQLGCHPSVGIYALPKLLLDLKKKAPLVEIELLHGLSRSMHQKVLDDEADLALVVNPVASPHLIIKQIGEDIVSLFVSSARDADHTTLIYDPALAQTQSILAQLRKKKIAFDRTIETGNLELVSQLVHRGVGVGVLPSRVVFALTEKGVRKFSEDSPSFQDRICVVYRPELLELAAGKILIECAKSCLA